MPQEIERKYLVRLEHWKPTAAGVLYRQGYLSSVKVHAAARSCLGLTPTETLVAKFAVMHNAAFPTTVIGCNLWIEGST
jgi:CYTH domain-containing protein